MKAYYFFLLLLGFLWSCNPIANNKRLSVHGKVSDPIGNPVSGIEIKTSSYTYILGSDLTDMNGGFDFVSLAPNTQELEIQINAKPWSDPSNSSYQEDFGSLYYHFTSTDLSNSFKLDTIQLHPKAQLSIETTTSATDTLSFILKYKKPELHYSVNAENNFETYTYSSENLSPSTSNFSDTYFTLQYTEAILTYSINDGEWQEISIPINQSEMTYVLSY